MSVGMPNTNFCGSCRWESHKRELGHVNLADELHEFCKGCECQGNKKAPTAEAVRA